jgi:hypothetical protein
MIFDKIIMDGLVSFIYAVGMMECAECGRQLAHLYEDHVELTRQLEKNLKNGGVAAVLNDTYIGKRCDKDITNYIHTYYIWHGEQKPTALTFEPINVVARALVADIPLTADQLPFGSRRETDGQRDIFCATICCLKNLQCNPVSTSSQN